MNAWIRIAEAVLLQENRAAFVKAAYLAAWKELEARGFPDEIISAELRLLLDTINAVVDAESERRRLERLH